MEKKMKNEMDTSGPFKGDFTDFAGYIYIYI